MPEGGGAGGDSGGGGGTYRSPQSVQSVPNGHSEYSEPAPPSSHTPSECSGCPPGTCVPGMKQVSVHSHVCPGASGGGGGDGGHAPLTATPPVRQKVVAQ